MSVRKITMYTIVCDRCGKDGEEDGYTGTSPSSAKDSACDFWQEIDGKDYCPVCLVWNDDETKLIPRP